MRSIRRIHSAAAFAAATLISLAACSGDLPQGPQISHVARVVVRPMNDTIQVGQQLEYYAVAFDSAGLPLANRSFTWTSSQPHVATIVAANPTDSARATGDSVGVTKIIAASEGIQSDPATLVVVAVPVVSAGGDTSGVLVACNNINDRVKGWLLTVKFSYSHSASGVDTSSHDPVAFSVDDSGEVTVRLGTVLRNTNVQNWDDDHTAAAVNGYVMVNDMDSDQMPEDLMVRRIQASGAATNDALGTGHLEIITSVTACTYQFYLMPFVTAAVIYSDGATASTDTVSDYMPSQIFSMPLPLIASNASGPLVLAGSADFPVTNMPGVFDTSIKPVLGEYHLTAWPAGPMKWTGVVPDLGYGTAKVSWRIVAVE